MKAYLVVGTYGGVSIKYACTDPNRALMIQQQARREVFASGLPLYIAEAMAEGITIMPIEVNTHYFYPLANYPETYIESLPKPKGD